MSSTSAVLKNRAGDVREGITEPQFGWEACTAVRSFPPRSAVWLSRHLVTIRDAGRWRYSTHGWPRSAAVLIRLKSTAPLSRYRARRRSMKVAFALSSPDSK